MMMMSDDDNDGQMIFGDLGGLKLPDICLTCEEKPRKNLTQEPCPDRGSNPGPLRDSRACYHLTHSGGRYIMEESRKAYRVSVGRPEGKTPLGKPRRRWEDNIKMDFREMGCDARNGMNLQAQDQRRA